MRDGPRQHVLGDREVSGPNADVVPSGVQLSPAADCLRGLTMAKLCVCAVIVAASLVVAAQLVSPGSVKGGHFLVRHCSREGPFG